MLLWWEEKRWWKEGRLLLHAFMVGGKMVVEGWKNGGEEQLSRGGDGKPIRMPTMRRPILSCAMVEAGPDMAGTCTTTAFTYFPMRAVLVMAGPPPTAVPKTATRVGSTLPSIPVCNGTCVRRHIRGMTQLVIVVWNIM